MLDNFVDVFSSNSKDPFWKSMFLLVTVLMPCSCTTNPGLGPQGASSCHGRRRRTVFHPQFQ